MDLKTRIAIFAYLKNLKAPIQTHFLKHYPTIGYILEEYYQQEQTDFKLDSIYQYGNQDSVYVYGVVGNRLALINSIEYLKAI